MKSTLPKISVIIPVLNGVTTLSKAIESVINQDYPNVEIIIIDGGSTDGTTDLIPKYDKDISKFICENDLGIYDAMNKGITIAEGEWIYFLGCDDYLEKNAFSLLAPYIVQNSELIYGNVFSIKHNKIYDGEFNLQKLIKMNICQQAIFYRKNLFYDLGFFDLKYKISADYAFNIKVFCSRKTIQFVPIIISFYSGYGISSINQDAKLLKDKLSLFSKRLNIKRFDSMFRFYFHQESINQTLYGSKFLGLVYMVKHSFYSRSYIPNIYTYFAFLKKRILKK